MLALGADCSGGEGGGRDTGLDKAGEPQTEKPEPVNFKARKFQGNGSTNIGTIKVPADAVFEFTNEPGQFGGFFAAYDAGFNLNMNSQSRQGQSVMAAGTYRNINVSGDTWTVTIRPR